MGKYAINLWMGGIRCTRGRYEVLSKGHVTVNNQSENALYRLFTITYNNIIIYCGEHY